MIQAPPCPLIDIPVLPELRGLIDAAIHYSICNPPHGVASDGFGRCADYAILGSRVLNRLTGGNYRTVAGSEYLDCGNGKLLLISADRKSRRKAMHLSQLSMFHCWIEASHLTAEGSPREEIVDFTVRHSHSTARQFGIPYALPSSVLPYQWIWRDELQRPDHLRDHPQIQGVDASLKTADASSTRLLHAFETENPLYFSQLESVAMNWLIKLIDQLDVSNCEA